jgi:hypothetical protein
MADKVNAFATANADNPTFQTGRILKVVQFQTSITAANSAAGDKLTLAGPFSYDDRIARIETRGQGTPALTGATNNDLGFWFKDTSGTLVELDKDILWDGITLASAVTYPDLLTGFNSALDGSKTIGQLLGKGSDQEPFGGVYLVLQTNNANTATGPLLLNLDVVVDCATGR